MMFGSSPQEQAISLAAAQAAVVADSLYSQTRDPDDRLVIVMNSDGLWSTQTVRNQRLLEQSYSQSKGQTIGFVGAAVAGVVGLGVLYFVFKR